VSAADDGADLGAIVDTTPADRPGPVKLAGRFCRIEKLDVVRHAESLWWASKDHDTVWTYMAYGPFRDEKSFFEWIEERVVLIDPFSYAVIDRTSDRAVGIVALMEIRPAMRVIEIGNIVYTPLLQRTAAATEAQYLMARYVFEQLRYRRYEWKCNARNAPSRRAAARFGFTYEGDFRQHMIVKGRNRDTSWFAMLDGEWPAAKSAYEAWLSPGNFDDDGMQKRPLAIARA
jgi:RimJ/RimL family protein N-acetyltransferase